MNVVIVGCGRVGALLATTLDAAGNEVAIIDTSVSYTHLTLPTILRV